MDVSSAVLFALLVLVMGGALCGYVGAGARLLAGRPLLNQQPGRDAPWSAVDIFVTVSALFFFLFIAINVQVAVSGVKQVSFEEGASPDSQIVLIMVNTLVNLGAMAASIALIRFRTGASLGDFGVDLRRIGGDVRLGITAFVMLAPIVYGIQAVLAQFFPSEHPLIEMLKQQPSAKFFLVSGLAAIIAAPLCEEYLFRLLLQGWLEKIARRRQLSFAALFATLTGNQPLESSLPGGDASLANGNQVDSAEEAAANRADEPIVASLAESTAQNLDTNEENPYRYATLPESFESRNVLSEEVDSERRPFWPIMVSALLFALMHFSHGPDWVALTVFAIGLGYLYQRTRRIVPCIVVHLALNSCTMIVLLCEVYGQPPVEETAAAASLFRWLAAAL